MSRISGAFSALTVVADEGFHHLSDPRDSHQHDEAPFLAISGKLDLLSASPDPGADDKGVCDAALGEWDPSEGWGGECG